MRVVFFEDAQASRLSPIALTRPVFELVCGCFSLRERVLRRLGSTEWGGLVRTELTDVCREAFPDACVNDTIAIRHGASLLVNGRWIPATDSFRTISHDNVGVIDDQIVWLQIDETEARLLDEDNWRETIARIAQSRVQRVPASGALVDYPWDLVEHNAACLRGDIAECFEARPAVGDHVVVLGDPAQVSVDAEAELHPFVVLDARTGPIRVDRGAEIQSFTRIEGPCHVGRDSQLYRALVRGGTTIGPVCRVGGEIEASILHGWVNKYHEGFLGHSYVCPWVNIGAMSTTSDLKNDYSSVTVPLEGKPIDTGISKVGSFIGDHARTAINSMFNTGSSVGVMAMVLPGGPLLPRYIPSFGVVWFGQVRDSWDLERSIVGARVAMERRGIELTSAQEQLLRSLHEQTAGERAVAVRLQTEREAARG